MRSFIKIALPLSTILSCAQFAQASENGTLIASNDQQTVITQTSKGSALTESDIEYIRQALNQNSADQSPVSFYGLFEGSINTSDSQRTTTPDFTGEIARLGAYIKANDRTNARIEFEFYGNQPNDLTPTVDPVSGDATIPPSSNNTVVLRQAQVNVNLVQNKTNSTTLSIGGIRIGQANANGPDAANIPSGFSRQDGLYVLEGLSMRNGATKIGFGAGVFNTLFGTTPGNGYAGWGDNGYLTQPSYWLSNSLNKSLAYEGTMSLDHSLSNGKSINVVVDYGTQTHAPYSVNNSGSLTEVRNVNHTEASISYNDRNLFGDSGVISGNGLTVWYEREANGQTQEATAVNGSNYAYTNGQVNDAETATLLGIGFSGDTGRYLNSIYTTGDRFTYAAAYTMVQNTFQDTSAQSYTVTSSQASASLTNQNYIVNQFSISGGYALNSSFEVALNLEHSRSNGPRLFTNPQGSGSLFETKSYIAGVYSF